MTFKTIKTMRAAMDISSREGRDGNKRAGKLISVISSKSCSGLRKSSSGREKLIKSMLSTRDTPKCRISA